MATVQKRGSKWYAIFVDGEGRQRQRSGNTDKAETLQLANRLEDEGRRVRLGDVDPQVEVRRLERSKLLPTHVLEYRANLTAAGRSDGHVAYTIGDLNALIAFAAAEGSTITSASGITRPLVDRWVLHQQAKQKAGEKGSANKTINRRVASVQAFLRHLSEHGGVTSYVLRKYPKLPTGSHHQTRQARALERPELDKLLNSTKVPQHRRDLYNVVVRSGLRMNEARQMVGKWFDVTGRQILIPAHVSKAKRDQTVPMADALVHIIKRICEGKGDVRVFNEMPTKQHTINQLRTDATAAGISNPGSLGFHAFRHTYCTLLAQSNVHPALLQKLARHSDVKTTLKYYVHLQRSDELTAVNTL